MGPKEVLRRGGKWSFSYEVVTVANTCLLSANEPRLEPPALAFQHHRPGQSHGQAVTLAWPGSA